MIKADYIIVGQGLAGSAVAAHLLKRKKTIVVFDDPESNNSSRIAAGLFNPVTGKKMVKTWLADQLFPYIHDFYSSIEKETGNQFFFPTPVYRPFVSAEEQNEWMGRSAEPGYQHFIQHIHTRSTVSGINDSFGGLELQKSGWLDTIKYISSVGILIRASGTLIQESFIPDNVSFGKATIRYGEIETERIIICSGTHRVKFFDWLPIRPLKGETLTILSDIDRQKVINRGIYMIPRGRSGEWRVGSTYNFHDLSPEPTMGGRNELQDKLHGLLLSPFETRDHIAGFRPTTPDRRPILGSHPSDSRILTFNGLGTKGVSLAPYFSEVLVRALENGGHIDKLVDIDRFKSLYSSSAIQI